MSWWFDAIVLPCCLLPSKQRAERMHMYRQDNLRVSSCMISSMPNFARPSRWRKNQPLPPVLPPSIILPTFGRRMSPEEAEERDGKAEEGTDEQEHAYPWRRRSINCEGYLPCHLKEPPNLPPVACIHRRAHIKCYGVHDLSLIWIAATYGHGNMAAQCRWKDAPVTSPSQLDSLTQRYSKALGHSCTLRSSEKLTRRHTWTLLARRTRFLRSCNQLCHPHQSPLICFKTWQ